MTALLMLGIFVLLLATDYVVRWVARRGPLAETVQSVAATALRFADLRLPSGLFFHPGHSWAALQPSGAVAVGVDDFVQKIAGAIDGIRLPEAGTRIRQGDSLVELQVGGRTLALPAPVSGQVASVNPALLGHPESLGAESLETEWLVTLEPTRLADELDALSVATRAAEWLRREISRLNEFIAMQGQSPALAVATPQDGGEPVVGVLRHLDDHGWAAFQTRFLPMSGEENAAR